jgi:hypothetical protein
MLIKIRNNNISSVACYRSILVLLLLLTLVSCNNKGSGQADKKAISRADATKAIKVDSSKKAPKRDSSKNTFDTTFAIFTDTSYKVTFHGFDLNSEDWEKKNATLTFSQKGAAGLKKIFQHSFYCMYPEITFKDFNSDKIEDLLIFYSTGARANPTYHLYLVDTSDHKLTHVRGFENLPNPDFDSVNNIVTSVGLAGLDYYWEFHRIRPSGKLINLGHGFTEDSDSLKYDKTVKRIIKEWGK